MAGFLFSRARARIKVMTVRVFIITSFLVFAACSLYRTSDREFFDGNATMGAPPAQALAPTSASCRMADDILAADQFESVQIDRAPDGVARVDYRKRIHPTDNSAADCRFVFVSEATEAELTRASKALVERYLSSN